MICIGIDVSKGYGDVAIIDDTKNLLFEIFQVNDNQKGHRKLEEKIEKVSKMRKGDCIRIGVESTGGYETNFVFLFDKLKKEYPLENYRLNPLSVKKYSEMDLHRAKTDSNSAIDIACYLLDMNKKMAMVELTPEIQGLRRLIKFAETETKHETAIKNHLQIILQQTFPELIRFCTSGVPRWLLLLLTHYQTRDEIAAASNDELLKIPFITNKIVDQLKKYSSESIAAPVDFATKYTIKGYAQDILTLMDKIIAIKKEVEKAYKSHSLNKLSTIYGIGEYIAAVLTAYTVDINRFEDVKKYIAFFGLDPKVSDSGDGIKKRRISKRGNSIVRKTLYMGIITCLKNAEHPVSRQYLRLRERGVAHFSAVAACMKKLLGIAYAILKSGKVFDINYENQKKAEEQSKKSLKDKKLNRKKGEILETDAPLSRKEHLRRKKVAESYKSTKDLSAGSSTTCEEDTKLKQKSKE